MGVPLSSSRTGRWSGMCSSSGVRGDDDARGMGADVMDGALNALGSGHELLQRGVGVLSLSSSGFMLIASVSEPARGWMSLATRSTSRRACRGRGHVGGWLLWDPWCRR